MKPRTVRRSLGAVIAGAGIAIELIGIAPERT
jgi:hypothetical protein